VQLRKSSKLHLSFYTIQHQQCTTHCQSKRKNSAKFANAIISYSGFCDVTPKREVSGIKQPHGHDIVDLTVKLYAINVLAQ